MSRRWVTCAFQRVARHGNCSNQGAWCKLWHQYRGVTMSTATTVEPAGHFWSEEPSQLPNRRRIRARIGGLHCSLCTGTIEKALGRQPGVDKVAVSLTHEQALIEYDPAVARPEQLLQTLRDK